MSTTMTPTQAAIARAKERIAAETARLAELENSYVQEAELAAQVVTQFQDGASIPAVAAAYGMSENAVRTRLRQAGLLKVKRRGMTGLEGAQATNQLRRGKSVEEVSDDMQIAQSVIRRLAKDLGLITRGGSRTDAQLAELAELEEKFKRTYGAGFSAVGEALRKYRQRVPAGGPEEPSEEGEGEVSISVGGVELSEEDLAKMNTPDSQPEHEVAVPDAANIEDWD